ncbi:hypothetical protein Q5H92_22895 [Hymenobacter sp. M29]|uniref:Uncharacterized protein n=1 Tax=Hymenobacter mellowenesis TaxID=3063995 RepID=A0ABT9AJD4_9BACT|nr:hypothetical protein [Hymenobacter sp. M29]MDO7849230.1 hypothetical protein [Hymenobacter sp. M29]
MGGKKVITIKQVLAEMAAAVEPFALRFVKLNESKGTGGEVVELAGQLLSGRGSSKAPSPKEGGEEVSAHQVRKPNHYDNMTRNLVSTLNGNYSKVHYPLILEFNGQKVIL